jgi:hypothetical protein
MRRLALVLVAPFVIAACDNSPVEPTRLAPEEAPSAIILPSCAKAAPDQVKGLISAVLYIRDLPLDQRIIILTPLFDAAKAIAANDTRGAIAALQRFVAVLGGGQVALPGEIVREVPAGMEKPLVKLPRDVADPLIAAARCLIEALAGIKVAPAGV